MSSLVRRDHVPDKLMVEEARNLLRQAVRVDEAKRIHDQGQAIKVYLRAQKAGKQAIDDAGEIILQATRRMGQLLKEQKSAGKRRKVGQRKQMSRAGTSDPATLEEMGLSRNQASRAQQIAAIPEETVEKFIRERRADADKTITVHGLAALAEQAREPPTDADFDEAQRQAEERAAEPDPVDDVVELYLALSYADRARFHERVAKERAA